MLFIPAEAASCIAICSCILILEIITGSAAIFTTTERD
jgi:hypothetical protein